MDKKFIVLTVFLLMLPLAASQGFISYASPPVTEDCNSCGTVFSILCTRSRCEALPGCTCESGSFLCKCIDIPPPPLLCSDGTPYGMCSADRPRFCSGGALVENCNLCSCPLSYECSSSGLCVKSFCFESCGDGVCQEDVCQGFMCPCAETVSNCPEDCLAMSILEELMGNMPGSRTSDFVESLYGPDEMYAITMQSINGSNESCTHDLECLGKVECNGWKPLCTDDRCSCSTTTVLCRKGNDYCELGATKAFLGVIFEKYCDKDGQWKRQKVWGKECEFDYECKRDNCYDGVCRTEEIGNFLSKSELGEECEEDEDCKIGKCENSVCVKRVCYSS